MPFLPRMSRNSRRTFIAWLLISFVLFALAGCLTMLISAVNGHPPFAKHAAPLYRPDFQTISVYFRGTSPESILTVNYVGPISIPIGRDIEYSKLAIRLPLHSQPKILINNLKDESSCSNLGNGFMDDAEGTHMRVEKPHESIYDNMYVITPEVPESARAGENNFFYVVCAVRPVLERETFTTKRAAFSFDDVSLEPTLSARYGVQDLTPVPGLLINVEFEDSEDIQWESQEQEPSLLVGRDTTYVLPVNGMAVVRWKDIGREQARDIILVIIGALIAIGATTLIEALRPFIETAAESKELPERKPQSGSDPEGEQHISD
jgi:hypothetical protein